MQRLAHDSSVESQEGHPEIQTEQDVFQFLCIQTKKPRFCSKSKLAPDPFLRLLEGSDGQATPASPNKGSVFITSKRQRKGYKPSRVPPSIDLCPLLDSASTVASTEPSVNHSEIHDGINKNGCDGEMQHLFAVEKMIVQQNTGSVACDANLQELSSNLPDNKFVDWKSNQHSKILTSVPNSQVIEIESKIQYGKVCRNLACKAKLSSKDSFCRRCSCSICKRFDDNKDPSLWILCNPDTGGCGLSCHIGCALEHLVAGVVIGNKTVPPLDGSYFCQSCGMITSLIGSWRRQLTISRDARRVDVFQERLHLSHRLLMGTKQHKEYHNLIDQAVRMLEAELSEMQAGSSKLARCIVNRLSCNTEVQKLIELAIEKADAASLDNIEDRKYTGLKSLVCIIHFEDVTSSSIVISVSEYGVINTKHKLVGYKLWHRKTGDPAYACSPTGIISDNTERFLVSNLHPLTEYTFKVVPFTVEGDLMYTEAGCSTKGLEEMKRPIKIFSSLLDVVLINAAKVGEGTSKQGNHGFDLNYSITEMENGNEDHVNQHQEVCQGMHMKEANSFNCVCAPSYSNISSCELRGQHLSNMHQYCDHSIPPFGCKSQENSVCAANCSPSLEPENGNKQILVLDQMEHFHGRGMNGFCSSICADTVTNIIEGDQPPQGWTMQIHSRDQSSNVGILQGTFNHMQGFLKCNAEAELNNYEFSVKIIRWLECEGHLKEEFRMKFLTWYTLMATEHEKRVVSVFIETFQDDPASLAGQLVDAFEDIIATSRRQIKSDNRTWS